MTPEEIARIDLREGDWAPKQREWRATHSQIGRAMKWTTKPVVGDMTEDNTIVSDFKMKMAMILRGNEQIEDLRFRPAAMVKNFEPKTRRKFKGVTKAIFKYGFKQLIKAEREGDMVKGEKIDTVVRWGLNLAAARVFGTVKHWPSTSMRGVHAEEPREDERPTNGLRREGKAALNRRYIGSVHKFHRWMYEGGASRANVEATTAELYAFARPSFTGDVVTADQVAPFPEGDAYLKALWQSEEAPRTPFRMEPWVKSENDPVIKKLWRILREGDGNRGPGYDQITYRILRQCEKMPLIMWLIHTFSFQTKLGLIFPAYKLGFVSYIPKPGAPNTQAPNLRPVTLLPVFFKILSKYITFEAYDAMRETVRGAYSHTPFTFQMGVNPGVAGCRDANLKLTAVLEDSRHRKRGLYCLFTDFKGAFTSLPLGLIVKTIDILPICPRLRKMWQETALGNQVRLIVNGDASDIITITRGVAQGNTISPLTFAVVKETVAKWIEKECRGYAIAGIEVKGMDYMDDEVRIADSEEEIRKMAKIQSEFAEWAGMRFGIHKCAYWGREFERGRGTDVELDDFTLCGEAIPQLAGYEAFKYLGEHKAPASAKTNQKPSLPRGPQEARQEAHEGKRALAKFKARVAYLDTPRIQKLHYAGKLDFLSQAARPLIEILCPMNPPPNYILDEATRIQHGAARRILGWPARRGAKRQFEMSTDHLGLRLPNFRTIRDSMLVNTAYAFINNLDPQVSTLFRHMVEEARIAAGIPRVPHGKIFLDWDLTYGNPVRDKNTQTKGLTYWEPTRTDPKARRKIGTRGKAKGRTYVAFLYHACQALGVRIADSGLFKVDIRSGDLEGLERVQIIGLYSDAEGPNAQAQLDKAKLELKEYTKEAVRHRDGLECVEKIATKQFAHSGTHAAGSRKWIRTASLSMPEYKTMIAAAFNVLPVKSVVSTWMRRGGIICDNCHEQKRETVKHLFCRCRYPLYEAIRTKRHDKVVCEFYCWVKLRAEKGKLGRLDLFQIWMADNTWGVPAGNNLIFPDILNDARIPSRRPDLIFQYQPPARRGPDGQMIRRNHQIEIWEVSVTMDNEIALAKRQKANKYNELVDVLCRRFPNSDVRFRAMIVGVMGTIPTSIKQTLREIQPQAQTSWVIHQIIQAIGNHNHKLWIVRDQLHNRRQNHPNEGAGAWVPKCRWLRREYFKYCENLIQREEWEVQPREPTAERPQLPNRTQIDRYYYKVLSNVARWEQLAPP